MAKDENGNDDVESPRFEGLTCMNQSISVKKKSITSLDPHIHISNSLQICDPYQEIENLPLLNTARGAAHSAKGKG